MKRQQRGDAVVAVLLILILVIVVSTVAIETDWPGTTNAWIRQCNAADGLAVRVQDVRASKLYCVRRDVLVPQEGHTL